MVSVSDITVATPTDFTVTVRARPFDYPYRGGLDPARTALLVVDMQHDFLAENGYFALKGYDPTPLRTIIPNVAQLVIAMRDWGARIVWTRQGYRADAADASPYEIWRAERAGIALGPEQAGALTRGSPGYDMVAELPVAPCDIIVDKTANGAFYGTDLELILRAQGITHLVFAGCTTDVCVHSTLREANDRKFQCLLVEDACASADAYAHAAAIHMVTVEDGIFGTVADTAALLSAVRHRSSSEGGAKGLEQKR